MEFYSLLLAAPLLQGLKPKMMATVMSELKLRPPKRRAHFTGGEVMGQAR